MNDLIFGKDPTTRITSIEVIDNQMILFRELEDGSIVTEYKDNKYWILLPEKRYSNLLELKGDQHYKWFFTCDTRERYLAARKKLGRSDFYSIWDPKENAMVFNGITYFKGMNINEVSVLSFDIESDGLKQTKKSEIYCITNTLRKGGSLISKGFFLDDYNSQAEMLLAWCKWVKEVNPSILLGHNIIMYDLPYLQHVADLNNVSLSLGRDGSDLKIEDRESRFRKDGSQEYSYNKPSVFGREIIDTWMLSIRYDIGRQFESYGLKPIVKHLGLEKPNRTFVDSGKIKEYYRSNPEMWEKVKQYALEDADDSLKLFDIMAPATFYFTQHISKPFQMMILSATGGQINNLLVRHYLQKGYSIPKAEDIKEGIEGGISFAIPKLYKNLVKIDLKSAYPSQILRFKLYDPKKDPDAAFYNAVKHFTYERFDLKKKYKETKEQYYYDREQTSKIFINSAYGAMTTPGLNFNCKWIGAKITEETRKVINSALIWASGKDKDYWMTVYREKTGKDEDSDA